MALVLIESTVATRGETTTSYSDRCCTKARAEALNCTVTAPSDAASNLLITGIKGNMPNLAVSMAGWTYGGTATSPSVTGNTGSGTVTYTYKASGASSYSSTKSTNAGTHTVKASVAETTNYIAKEVTSTYTVAKASRSGSVSCANVTYGSTVTATVSGNTESGTVTWGVTAGTGTATISSAGVVTSTKVGTVTITASVAATANYKAYTATSKQITINKRTVTITAPTATNRTYTGSAQTIFAAGSCTTGGKMYYSDTNKTFSTSTWSTTVPTPKQTTAGTYTLYYYCYVSDTTNNTGTNINTIKSVQATISKKATAAPVLTAGGTTTYTGTTYYAKAATGSGNPAGKIYYGASSGATTYNITASTTATNLSSMGRKNVGTTTIYAFFRPTDTTNYADSSSASTTVKITKKANQTISFTSSTGSVNVESTLTKTATRSVGDGAITYSSSDTSKATVNSSTGVVTGVAEGTCTITATAAATTNYNSASASYTLTVQAATSTITIKNTSSTYTITMVYEAQYDGDYHETSNIYVSPNSSSKITVGTIGAWTLYFSSAYTINNSSGTRTSASVTSNIGSRGDATINATVSQTSITLKIA